MFKQYSKVRVTKLLRINSDYDDWKLNQRPPAVGDTGTLVDFQYAHGVPVRYTVESVGPDGAPIWMCDFEAEELEMVKE